ncbi:MAG: ChaN family lipoprotein, partial [Burkholderiales bacterium]
MASTSSCLAPATWYAFTNGTLQKTSESEVLARASRRDVVLLGEHHDDPDHHLWQLQVLAALHMLRPEMVIGFEAFPRRVQAVLDQWTAGQLTPSQFLERVEWQKIWSVPAALYLPLFEFARLNRIPMAALNVDRTLTAEISRNGWNAVPEERREGVSRAAPALRAYEDSLFEAFTQHSKVDDKRAASRDDP